MYIYENLNVQKYNLQVMSCYQDLEIRPLLSISLLCNGLPRPFVGLNIPNHKEEVEGV